MASHPLLRGPGLLVANDGAFSQEDRDAITQINLGTKGTEERAIGRFGKGLKSVFAWCEAFFIIARTDRDKGWPEDSITDFFNPWHGWRHQDWEDAFEKSGDLLIAQVGNHLAGIYPTQARWLAFWFPLRCKFHKEAADGLGDWIFENLPGDDPEFHTSLSAEFYALVPSLVSLRGLRRLTITSVEDNRRSALVWEFPQEMCPHSCAG